MFRDRRYKLLSADKFCQTFSQAQIRCVLDFHYGRDHLISLVEDAGGCQLMSVLDGYFLKLIHRIVV